MKNKQYPLHHDHGTVTISRDVFKSMAAELERLRPMEASLELAEANRDAYKKRVEELTAEHHKERDEYIEMVAQRKKKLVEQESENRKLKRALWLSRAKRAKARKNYWYVRSIYEGDKDLWSIDGSIVKYIGCIKRSNFDWLKIWSEVECKCLAKAKEYK